MPQRAAAFGHHFHCSLLVARVIVASSLVISGAKPALCIREHGDGDSSFILFLIICELPWAISSPPSANVLGFVFHELALYY